MIELAIILRALQMLSHSAHNNCSRTVFHQDHEFFGDLYSMAEGMYDALIERHIGTTDQEVDLGMIIPSVSAKLQGIPSANVKENKVFYIECMKLIQEHVSKASILAKDPKISLGTNNLLADQCDKLEVIIYKIKRRIAA